ncbi:hypothetical protein RHSIM_Rhsim02G0133600 [Rhododendron simsii]|uniref:Uncharacterized protein n=1 Tax=Rhododendron simsii TaxID=118357 RepID=A0A834HF09_RHOSS|nr:hypothetical protein RHSIM_Rhsim02G0133600 [Rhododendron simsii]
MLRPRMTIMDEAEARNDDHGHSYLVELRTGIGMFLSDRSFSLSQKRQLLLAFRCDAEIRASVFLGVGEEDRAIEKEEGLPHALFVGSCNDRVK